jgi:hypothetical protein
MNKQKPEQLRCNGDIPIPVDQSIQYHLQDKKQVKGVKKPELIEGDINKDKPEQLQCDADIPISIDQSIKGVENVEKPELIESESQQGGGDFNKPYETNPSILVREAIEDELLVPSSKPYDIDDQTLGFPILEATLVEEEERPESIQIRIEPSGPVFDAILMTDEDEPSHPWCGKHKRLWIAGLLLIICILVATMVGWSATKNATGTNDLQNQSTQEYHKLSPTSNTSSKAMTIKLDDRRTLAYCQYGANKSDSADLKLSFIAMEMAARALNGPEMKEF